VTENNRLKRKKVIPRVVNAVDLFCGAGGTSSGLIQAVNSLGYDIKLTAINHWDVAIATHTKNHEDVEHFCQSIDTIDPIKIVPGGRLQLLVASPECTHHSNARGGKPRSDQKRADAWLLMRWINNLYIENILIENVKEFESWGPLTAKGLPDKRYKGEYFQQFLAALRVNYSVEHRVLNCADYGDPTTRERLFILARRGHKKIVWPSRSHASRKELAKMAVQPDFFPEGELQPWVPARKIIDWSLEGKSIFGRKKPLSPNTMRRIFKGLEKHGLKNFMVNLKNQDRRDRSVDEPTFTQAAGGNHQAVVEPFIVPFFGEREGQEPRTRDIDEPAPTVTTHGRMGVVEVEPFIVSTGHTTANGSNVREVDEPVATIVGSDRLGVVEVEPFTLSVERAQTNRSGPRPVDEPVATITGSPRIGIVEGEISPISAGGPELEAKSVDEPLRTVLTRDHQAIIEAFLVKFHGGAHADNRSYPVDEPISTLDTSNRFGLVEAEPFVFNMAHTGKDSADRDGAYCKDVDDPLSTVAGKGMYGLVETEPFIVSSAHGGNTNPPKSVDEPLGSVLGSPKFGVVESDAFLLGQQSGAVARGMDEPVPTIAGKGAIGKVDIDPYLVRLKNNQDAGSVDDPLKTLTTKESYALAEPYIVKFYGAGEGADSIHDSLSTVTAKDRFALCIPSIGIALDIRFRMLQPHELAAAMSFPKDYEFTGNREARVKHIGNAVPLLTARALCRSLLS
jgi:DNA (cytosine-5)-methyltransferase 1